MVIVPGNADEEPFSAPAARELPPQWLQRVPGKLIAAAHVALVKAGSQTHGIENLSRRWFAGNPLIGAEIGGGAALAVSDFHIHADGFSRFLVLDRSLTRHQAGRMVQRLFEIDAYRVLALMALPAARELTPIINEAEAEIVTVAAQMAEGKSHDEPRLLEQLTRLEARIHRRHFETAGRFSAAEAYYKLVQRRTRELREQRIQGFQTFEEFVERRLSPAMATCAAISLRQEKLSQRVAQTTELLSTRVEVHRLSEAQGLLQSMNRRALLQLRLQQTVEGLSVAAITYYVVGLVSYVAKGVTAGRNTIATEVVVALAVPVVLLLVAVGMRRLRRLVLPVSQREASIKAKASQGTGKGGLRE
jgi:uncharacterized membrane-anchored protein